LYADKALTMSSPLQITFRQMSASPFLRTRIEERANRLLKLYERIVDCRVVVEAPHRHHHKGKPYTIAVELTVPGATLACDRNPRKNHAHEDIYVALHDAFDAAERQLRDYLRRKGAA
jgi:ribosomal subunit interface protein